MVQINCQDARTDVLDYVRLAFAIRQSADLRKRGGDFIVYEQSGGLLGGTLGGASIAAIPVTASLCMPGMRCVYVSMVTRIDEWRRRS